jgi:hypothetical protein
MPCQLSPSQQAVGVVGQRQVQRHEVAGRQQIRQRAPSRQPVVAGAGVQHGGAHRGDDARDVFGDVAVADQADSAGADIAHRFAQRRVGRPAPAFASGPIQRRQPTQGGQHQQYRAFGD